MLEPKLTLLSGQMDGETIDLSQFEAGLLDPFAGVEQQEKASGDALVDQILKSQRWRDG